MKSLRILSFVLVAALFVAGYTIAQDNGASSEKCPVTGNTGACTSGKEACDKTACPVTGKTNGGCPTQGVACPTTGKTSGECPAVKNAVANAKSSCDSAQSCCGTCQGDPKLAKKDGECCPETLAKNGGNQTHCPVSNAKINKQVFVDYKGKRVYLGCKACPDTFNKSPDAYVKKLEQQGVVFAMAPVPQTVCPVSGAKINKEVFVDYKGKRVYLGCNACPDKFNKSPETYIKKMEQQGVTFAMAPAPAKSAKMLKKAGEKMEKSGEKAKECCGSCSGEKKAGECSGSCEGSEKKTGECAGSCSGEKKSSCESKKVDG